MKTITVYILSGCVALLGVLFYVTAQSAQADDRPPLSSEHKQKIVANCTSAKSSIHQLHRSDVLLRVNRGQLYEYIGTKLMARLNSRLALNQLDAGTMVAIAAQYDKDLNAFRNAFRTYEEQVTAVLRIDCAKEPETFYYAIRDAKNKRSTVHQQITNLNDSVDDYYKAFNRFADTYRTAQEDKQ